MEGAFEYLKSNRDGLIKSLEKGTYKPPLVRRVEIDKPEDRKRKIESQQ